MIFMMNTGGSFRSTALASLLLGRSVKWYTLQGTEPLTLHDRYRIRCLLLSAVPIQIGERNSLLDYQIILPQIRRGFLFAIASAASYQKILRKLTFFHDSRMYSPTEDVSCTFQVSSFLNPGQILSRKNTDR